MLQASCRHVTVAAMEASYRIVIEADGTFAVERTEPGKERIRTAMNLLSYWRDEAAHGGRPAITEIEAHDAMSRLLRFAQFVAAEWETLTR